MATITFQNAEEFEGADLSSSFVLFMDGVLYDPDTPLSWSFDSTSKTLTVSGVLSIDVDKYFQVVCLTWQWCPEGLFYFGDRFWSSYPRAHVVPNVDNVVKVPETLTYDIRPLTRGALSYPIVAYKTRAFGDTYTFDAQNTPTADDEYSFHNGAAYVGGQPTFPTPYFVAFGTIGTGDVEPVYFSRRRYLEFNNGSGILDTNLQVFVDKELVQLGSDSPEYNYYKLYTVSETGALVETTGLSHYIGFEGSEIPGVDPLNRIELVNVDTTYCGSASLKERWAHTNNVDGSYYPFFGLGQVSDYNRGLFPSVGCVFGSRLYLSGVPGRENVILASSIYDAFNPGEPYSFFQITEDIVTQSASPFDLYVNSSVEKARAMFMQPWRNGLFYATDKDIYRIYNRSEIGINGSNVLYASSSNRGVISRRGFASTGNLFFVLLSDGLYALTMENEFAGTYTTQKVSQPIDSLLAVLKGPYAYLAHLTYDSFHNKLFIFIPEPNQGDFEATCRVLILHLSSQAFSEYAFLNYMRSLDSAFIDNCVITLSKAGNMICYDYPAYEDLEDTDVTLTRNIQANINTRFYLLPRNIQSFAGMISHLALPSFSLKKPDNTIFTHVNHPSQLANNSFCILPDNSILVRSNTTTDITFTFSGSGFYPSWVKSAWIPSEIESNTVKDVSLVFSTRGISSRYQGDFIVDSNAIVALETCDYPHWVGTFGNPYYQSNPEQSMVEDGETLSILPYMLSTLINYRVPIHTSSPFSRVVVFSSTSKSNFLLCGLTTSYIPAGKVVQRGL